MSFTLYNFYILANVAPSVLYQKRGIVRINWKELEDDFIAGFISTEII